MSSQSEPRPGLWQRLVVLSNDRFDSDMLRKNNSIVNQVFAFYIIVLVAISLVSLVEGHIHMPQHPWQYAMPTSAGAVLMIAILLLTYYLKARFRSLIWTQIPFLCGLAYMITQSILFGEGSGFFLTSLSLAPLPIFFMKVLPRWLMLSGIALVIFSQLFLQWWFRTYEAPFAIPEIMSRHIFYYVIIYLNATVVLLSYYWWRENDSGEVKLRSAVEQLQDRDNELQQELDFAAAIQEGILPTSNATWNELTIASTYLPLGKVSGDYIDMVVNGDHVDLLMADISGHGVPAALVTMLAKQAFTSAVQAGHDPAQIFDAMNADLTAKVKTQEYLTAFMIRVDQKYNITYSNAAHVAPVYYNSDTEAVSFIDSEGLIIGARNDIDMQYANKTGAIAPGDRILLFTDGLTEQKNAAGEMFSTNRLAGLVRHYRELPPGHVIDKVINEYHAFRGSVPMKDDVSLMLVERKLA